MNECQNGNVRSFSSGDEQSFSNSVKEQIKRVSELALKKFSLVNNEAPYNEENISIIAKLAYKLLPLPIRIRIKKDHFKPLKVEIKNLLFELKNETEQEIIVPDIQSTIDKDQSEQNLLEETRVPASGEEAISVPPVPKEQETIFGKEDIRVGSQMSAEELEEDTKIIIGGKADTVMETDLKPVEKPFGKLKEHMASTSVAAEKVITSSTLGEKKSFAKYIIAGIAIIALIVVAFFVKSYLSKPPMQPETIQRPVEPAQGLKPAELPESEPKQVESQRPPAPIESKPDGIAKQPIPSTPIIPEQKQEKYETVKTTKQQPQTIPDKPKEQAPIKQEKKTFAPPSRDNF
jgi:hypothetical protein